MPSEQASKFPNKPWGTAITAIGLAKQDSKRYEGYTLVDIEPLQGSADLYWVFEKLDGAVWETKAKSRRAVIPEKFRGSTDTTETTQDVDPNTQPSAIEGDMLTSIVTRTPNTGKAVKRDVAESINDVVLEGQNTGQWGIEDKTEKIVVSGAEITPYGFLTKESIVAPLGNGKSIESVSTYPAVKSPNVVYTLEDEETDALTSTAIYIKKSLVNAAAASDLAAIERSSGWFPKIQARDKWHSILLSQKLDDSILNVKHKWVETGSIQLPNILEEVGVIWNSKENGNRGSAGAGDIAAIISKKLNWTVRAEASATASVNGKAYTKIVGGYRGPAKISVVRSFVYGPPLESDISVAPYDFGEVYGTLSIGGSQMTQAGQSHKTGKGKIHISHGSGSRSHTDGTMSVHQFGPVVHKNVKLGLSSSSATANASYVSFGGSTPSRGIFPAAYAHAVAAGGATLELPTSGVPLESGATYLLKVVTKPYRLGYWTIEEYTATVP
jgi:hypothetical protein